MAANGAQYGVATVHYYWIGAIPAMVFLGLVMMPFYYGSKVRCVPEYLRLRFNTADAHVQRADVRVRHGPDRRREPVRAGARPRSCCWAGRSCVGIIVAAVIVLVYITLGGLSSAIYNEVLQFFVILAALIPLTLVGLHDVGGWSGLKDTCATPTSARPALHAWRARARRRRPTRSGRPGSPIVFGLGFVLAFGYWTTNFAEVQRALSAKDSQRRAAHAADRRLPEDVHPVRSRSSRASSRWS